MSHAKKTPLTLTILYIILFNLYKAIECLCSFSFAWPALGSANTASLLPVNNQLRDLTVHVCLHQFPEVLEAENLFELVKVVRLILTRWRVKDGLQQRMCDGIGIISIMIFQSTVAALILILQSTISVIHTVWSSWKANALFVWWAWEANALFLWWGHWLESQAVHSCDTLIGQDDFSECMILWSSMMNSMVGSDSESIVRRTVVPTFHVTQWHAEDLKFCGSYWMVATKISEICHL